MSLTSNAKFSCPYCMEINDIEIDPDNDIGQQQIADCQICCSPIEILITQDNDNDFIIQARTDSE
ncbi:CPXCG motif-containing cysteine-rich protein [Paraglaciecola polaris]|nr:CPXCG motif-containing cysteine-rich protein [Paraglaciecola polaris]